MYINKVMFVWIVKVVDLSGDFNGILWKIFEYGFKD